MFWMWKHRDLIFVQIAGDWLLRQRVDLKLFHNICISFRKHKNSKANKYKEQM